VSSKKILFVDDEKEMLSIFPDFIDNENLRIFLASDAHSALKILEEEEDIDLIISDYFMPEMNGFEMLEKIRDSGNNTRFILFTAHFTKKMIEPAKKLECDDIIKKGSYSDLKVLRHIVLGECY